MVFAMAQLIQQIYVTTPVGQSSADSTARMASSPDSAALVHGSSSRKHEQAVESKALVVADGNSPLKRHAMSKVHLTDTLSSGWSFPPVTLATVDEQYLFEFEVKLKLRTTTEDIVSVCQSFRNELLRNFPVEVFLQRPAILQYLLYLVQQPFFPSTHDEQAPPCPESATCAMGNAFRYSFGTNYFDELGSSSFSFKPSNLTTAVYMAALRAIESFLYAVLRASKVCMNPVYLVYESVLGTDFLNTYDTRRTFYPRAMPDKIASADGSAGSGATDQFSLSGSICSMFTSLLPLLTSSHHPRLHLLNVLHLALPLLPEKGSSRQPASVGTLDKKRLEQILLLVGEFCVPVNADMARMECEYSEPVVWRILELIIRLLQCCPPASYHVASKDIAEQPSPGDAIKQIVVPERIWRFVKMCIANPKFDDVAKTEWKTGNIVTYLSEIDVSLPSFLEANRMVESNSKQVAAFIALSEQYAEALDGNVDPMEVRAQLSLEAALKVALAIRDLNDAEARVAVDGILLAFWATLVERNSRRLEVRDANRMRAILVRFIPMREEKRSSRATQRHPSSYFCSRVAEMVSGGNSSISMLAGEARQHFVLDVLCDPKVLGHLLFAATACDTNEPTSPDALWTIMTVAFSELAAVPANEITAIDPVIPFLQHFAFMEPRERVPAQLRAAQPLIVEIINRAEKCAPVPGRLILIARCLLHQSSYLRKAAASGLLSVLSEADPSSFQHLADKMIEGYEDVLGDPFASPVRGGDSMSPFGNKLVEVAFPPGASKSGTHRKETDISSSLAKVSALRKLLTASSPSIPDIKETAVKELVMVVENMSSVQFSLLEELGEVTELKDLGAQLLRAAMEDRHLGDSEAFVEAVLILLRNILRRSVQSRKEMRDDVKVLLLLTPHIFASSVAVRAQMYYIVLLLTLSYENFAPSFVRGDSSVLPRDRIDVESVPELVKDTFGLHSSRWNQCYVKTCRMDALWEEVDAEAHQENASGSVCGARVVSPSLTTRSAEVEPKTDQTSTNSPPFSSDFDFVLVKLKTAKSHAKFLNALYHLMQLTEATEAARQWVVSNWEQLFDRYIAVSPQGERDEVIVGSILSCLNSLVMDMERQSQLRLLLVVKRSFIPLLKGAQSKSLSIQVLRILLHLSSSEVGDLFLSIAFDTNLLDVLCNKYASLYSTHPTLHALMLETVLRFVSSLGEQGEDAEQLYHGVIYHRLLSLVSPLLSIACRHRVPGSFIERDVFAMASQSLVGIIQVTPRDRLLGGDASVLSSDNSLLVDNSWSSRLLFDHSSQLRELGFSLLATSLKYAALDAGSRLVQLAIETSMDETECDAVRGAACSVIYEALLHFEDSSDIQKSQLVTILGEKSLVKNVLRALSNTCKDDKLLVTCGLTLSRLLRLLFTKRSVFAEHFGDLAEELAIADQEYDMYRVLVQVGTETLYRHDFADLMHSC